MLQTLDDVRGLLSDGRSVRALLDTSYSVANETGQPLGDLAGVSETEVSVVTLAELTLGESKSFE